MRFECVSRTHVGLRRKINEDAVLVRSEAGLWAVADGMGGHDAGEVASAAVVAALNELPGNDSLDQFVRAAIDELGRVNHELIELAHTRQLATIGSTVVGLAVGQGHFCFFWAGDSRGFRLRGGELEQVTRDHSLVQDLVEAGMLAPEDAADHPNGNIITRAVGVTEALNFDTVAGPLRPGDTFLLASDGLTRVVPLPELERELTRAEPAQAADTLIDMVLDLGAPDNVSIVIVRALA